MLCYAEVGVKHALSAINLDCLLEIIGGLLVSFLLVVDVSEAPPCIVMSLICFDSFPIESFSLLKIFILYKLMTA